MTWKTGGKAFTLIELLVAVGLLGIIVAISASGYNDAVTRAKTSRVSAEFKTITVGIAFYVIDHNTIPRMAHQGFYDSPDFDSINGVAVNGVLSKCISTPVAYLSTFIYGDPFMISVNNAPLDEKLYTYQDIPTYQNKIPASVFWPKAREFYGDYRLVSVGPDLHFDHGFANSAQLPYDPTNGVISSGNIIASSKTSPGAMPPIPDLLGSPK